MRLTVSSLSKSSYCICVWKSSSSTQPSCLREGGVGAWRMSRTDIWCFCKRMLARANPSGALKRREYGFSVSYKGSRCKKCVEVSTVEDAMICARLA